jgi:peptidoglycan/LPS O-acetylase OafA/YrhL
VARVTQVGSVLLLALIGLVSYAIVERPARAWIRVLLEPRQLN